jgi:hypothetical protein
MKKARNDRALLNFSCGRKSALTRLEARIGLVDDVNAALATDNTVVAMAATQRLQRIADLHGLTPVTRGKTRYSSIGAGLVPNEPASVNPSQS